MRSQPMQGVANSGRALHLVFQVTPKNHPIGSDGVQEFSYVAAGGHVCPGDRSSGSTWPLCVAYNEVPSRDRMSAGLDSEGTHSIQTRQPSCRHSGCQDVASNWMSQERLQPFTKAQQTLWLSIKNMISFPRSFSPYVWSMPAAAMSSIGMISVFRLLKASTWCCGVSTAAAHGS